MVGYGANALRQELVLLVPEEKNSDEIGSYGTKVQTMPADRTQANQGTEKVPKPTPAPLQL